MIDIIVDNWVKNRLYRFVDRHRGETCYIFGAGSSIKWFDIRRFSDHVGIATNLVPFHKHFEGLPIKYITITQPWIFTPKFLRPYDESVDKFQTIADFYRRQIIDRYSNIDFFVHPTSYPFLCGKHISCLFRRIPIAIGMNEEINRFDACSGAFRAALMIAYLLGFSKAYLVGFDAWVLEPANDLRWLEHGKGSNHPIIDRSEAFIQILRERMDVHAVGVGGESSNIGYITYENLFGEKPRYQENIEILEPEAMNALASHPSYKINAR